MADQPGSMVEMEDCSAATWLEQLHGLLIPIASISWPAAITKRSIDLIAFAEITP